MEALIELCDLIALNPLQFPDKLSWICDKCPPPEYLSAGSPRVSRSQLNAVIAVARFISKCSDSPDLRPKSVVIEFLRSIPFSFTQSFWPHPFSADFVASFFLDFIGYVSKAAQSSPDFSEEVAGFTGEVVLSAIAQPNSIIARAFLVALSQNFLAIESPAANKLVTCLIEQFAAGPGPITPVELNAGNSDNSSSQSSPPNGNHQPNGSPTSNVSCSSSGAASKAAGDDATASTASSRGSVVTNGGSHIWRSNADQLAQNLGLNDGALGGSSSGQQVVSFEEESVEFLERQEIAFKVIAHVLEKVRVDPALLEQARLIGKKQIQSMSAFLKIRKRDWHEQGSSLKARINTKLSVYKAAVSMKIKSLSALDSDSRSVKRLVYEAVAILIDAAEACLLSGWRKLKTCEELFSSLLLGVAQIAIARGGQPLRILLIRLKPIVLNVCAQPETWSNNQGTMFDSVTKASCQIIESCWAKERAPVDTYIMGLATSIRERNDYGEQDNQDKPAIPFVQLNVIRLFAELSAAVNKSELVDVILPLFIESLEEGDASAPSLLRLRLLDAVSRMASLGFEKSYRETVVLMTRSYLNKLSSVGSAESKTEAPEATTERVETLPAGFLLIATGLTTDRLRADYRHRLLSLCSDVGLAAESKNGRSGADFLGPLLPAVAAVCSDFDPTSNVEPSVLKLFRNLWFYVALFGLAPPIQKTQVTTKSVSSTLNSVGGTGTISLQAVNGPYMWNVEWSAAVNRIAQGTPPLVVSSVKWLEDELELNALHNPGSRQGSGNEKAALAQRTALSAALGGRVDVTSMTTISGVKATYLLAVAFLEIIRFSSNGGVLNGGTTMDATRSAFTCVFEYLKTPNLMPAVFQCLTAIVHRAFETAVSSMEDRVSEIGREAEGRDSVLTMHTCFLIKSLSQREDHIRDIAENLLTQLRDRFPQVLWDSSCLDSLLFSFLDDPSSAVINDPAWTSTVRSLYQRIVREWIIKSLSNAPCTSQGLLQDKLCKANNWQRAQPTIDVVLLLSEIRIGTGKNDNGSTQTGNIPAVLAAAAASSGANLKVSESFNLEIISSGKCNQAAATVKCNHAGEIAGMRRLYNSIGGFQSSTTPTGFGLGAGLQRIISGAFPQQPQAEDDSFNGMLLNKFVRLLQQFVNIAEKGGEVVRSEFRETCSQATVLLLSNLSSGSKSNVEGFSQLLRLLCWCPAYISTHDAMETGVFIWTWLVSAAPQLGALVLAELVDAWLWTIDTKRGLFASEARYCGPAAKLRPHLAHGEPESQPQIDLLEQIIAHRLWLGFLIDRFEAVRHQSVEQLLLLGRMLQGTTKLPWNFSHHPAATGTFFTLMHLGLKYCSCQFQGNLQKFQLGLQLLEDRIYRAALGWFAYEPEWYDTNYTNFTQCEAQSVTLFVHYLSNIKGDAVQLGSKGNGQENGNSLADVNDLYHPVWGQMENYAVGREKRRQLLLMLCQHEGDRLEVWAQPTNTKETSSRPKISSDKWIEHARTAFAVDPRIALSVASRFPTNTFVKTEVTQLVQAHIMDVRNIPEALPYFITPKAVDDNSVLLQQLPHWAPCSITQALEFLTPAYKGHPRVMAYVLRVLESYPPERVTFFMPQLVQTLRHDDGKLVEGYLLRAAQRSDIFAHILIWHLQGETVPEAGKDPTSVKNGSFLELLPAVRQHIIDGFNPKALDIFKREFDFFDKVTSISGVLYPLPKEERRAGIKRELEKIELDGEDLYLPTATTKLVTGIQVDSGIPLQSAAKVPIMITFNVVDRDGDRSDVKPQACIFKVGDDCRQDVLALQVIALLRDIFEAIGLNLYLFPYGVLPTGPERGIIEVVPNTRSRSQMGETTDGGLLEIFQQDYGPVGSASFEAARQNFIISSAGYAVASLLLQPKDRHNGNLLFDNAGRLVHIDFGFILETSPGGNMRFESAHFKLSHEMTQLLDPSGVMKSDTWNQFLRLCVKGYLAARRHMEGIITTVSLMLDSGLPCFSRGDPIGNLRKRFHPEMSEREAANFMTHVCKDAYNKWTTAGYDLIQYLQQGIEK
ncbi:phosphatidylinositol 4-kinase alpha 1 [Lathyrus oleraceus]|uniref:1-phosphatidylinositol 4-kinase n=1 Tax=Pisum sativum TaxID=3888 RepID=A0A9D4WJA5_PEA|nr:phosphatidylinositol 4-kinase alpha 1 [Pisum sativum]KAI5402557.1 Phosphatidylinositol 4-kinase alpha 1, variant 2 [Pisum sativum]